MNRNDQAYIVKTAQQKDLVTTIEQIHYLQNLPDEIKSYFPEITEFNITAESVSYHMPFYKMNQLDDALLDPDCQMDEIHEALTLLIDLLFSHIYGKDSKPVPEDFVLKTHIQRMEKRIHYFLSQRPDLCRLILSPALKINGEIFTNTLPSFDFLLREKNLESLTPSNLSFVHGDLEANHILFLKQQGEMQLKLLDPRSTDKGGDFAYDLGKLFQSIHGKSHVIQRGQFSLKYELEKDIPEIEFYVNSGRPSEYKDLFDKVINRINERCNDKNWEKRTLFSEAAHFLSAPPFFLESDCDAAAGLYLQGILLLNDFMKNHL
ncbi:hypothetical protein [Mesobacillus zeae]|nr:hypothetical protein [Mesobacillus zeae]